MPVALRIAGYRFYFYSFDCSEPAHMHVERQGQVAKMWLATFTFAVTGGFRPRELREITRIATDHHTDHHAELLAAWASHCDEQQP